jgi:hypothetical protein
MTFFLHLLYGYILQYNMFKINQVEEMGVTVNIEDEANKNSETFKGTFLIIIINEQCNICFFIDLLEKGASYLRGSL